MSAEGIQKVVGTVRNVESDKFKLKILLSVNVSADCPEAILEFILYNDNDNVNKFLDKVKLNDVISGSWVPAGNGFTTYRKLIDFSKQDIRKTTKGTRNSVEKKKVEFNVQEISGRITSLKNSRAMKFRTGNESCISFKPETGGDVIALYVPETLMKSKFIYKGANVKAEVALDDRAFNKYKNQTASLISVWGKC